MHKIELDSFEAGENRVDLNMEGGLFAGGILILDVQSGGYIYRPFTSQEANEWANLLPLRERKIPVLEKIRNLIFGE